VAERRLTQKDIKQPDQFISFSVQVLTWAKDHTTHLLFGALGVVIIIGLIIGWSIWQTQQQRTAEVLLYDAVRLLKNNEIAATEQVRGQLQRITRDYGATPAAALAAWYLGHLYFQRGDYTAALAAYEQARQWSLKGQALLIPPLITLDIGYAQEATGNCERAISSFAAVVQSTADWLHGEAFLGIGRCYEATGATAKALATYEQALSKATISGAMRQQIEERQALIRMTQSAPSPPTASETGTTSPQDMPSGKP
jgi:predicted negative regulator of RcsB-dependent stress response